MRHLPTGGHKLGGRTTAIALPAMNTGISPLRLGQAGPVPDHLRIIRPIDTLLRIARAVARRIENAILMDDVFFRVDDYHALVYLITDDDVPFLGHHGMRWRRADVRALLFVGVIVEYYVIVMIDDDDPVVSAIRYQESPVG